MRDNPKKPGNNWEQPAVLGRKRAGYGLFPHAVYIDGVGVTNL
jgi:hypothetical protein